MVRRAVLAYTHKLATWDTVAKLSHIRNCNITMQNIQQVQLDLFDTLKKPLPKRSRSKVDGWIDDLVGALTYPLIVHPGGWGDTIPHYLRRDILTARMIQLMRAQAGKEESTLDEATDEEAIAYLMTASLAGPLSHKWYVVYMSIFCDWMEKKGKDIPADILQDRQKLTGVHADDLRRLKGWIRQKQRNVIREKT